jgi:dTMP kinase
MDKGKFIVIDGLDGSGKKTQLDLLVDYCDKKKIETATVDFPQYYKTFFGKLVGRYLNGEFGGLEETNPYLASLTYAGDRWQAKERMEQAINSGQLLLANRYVSSSMGFMAAKFGKKKEQKKFVEWLKKLEFKVYGIPEPDLVIYLQVPPDIGQKLVLKKGRRKYVGDKNSHDLHEENKSYLEKVEQIYLDHVDNEPKWKKIACLNQNNELRGKNEIHEKIVKLLQKKDFLVQ